MRAEPPRGRPDRAQPPRTTGSSPTDPAWTPRPFHLREGHDSLTQDPEEPFLYGRRLRLWRGGREKGKPHPSKG